MKPPHGQAGAALLALDTSTRIASVAVVAQTGAVLAARTSEVSTHSETLLALIDAALAETRLSLGDLAAIACGAGPGSFTGLRIGMATAKGLCLGSGRPILLISSLAALAAVAPEAPLVLACLDARKGELFVGAYGPEGPLGAESAIRPSELAGLAARFAEQAGHAPLFVGDGATRYPELGELGRWIPKTPQAAQVGGLAWTRLHRGETDDLAAAVPRYIRPPEITQPRPRPATNQEKKS